MLLGKVKLGKYEMPPYIPKAAQDLIARLLVVDPKKRMRLKDVKQHPYFKGNGFALQYKQIPDMPPAVFSFSFLFFSFLFFLYC